MPTFFVCDISFSRNSRSPIVLDEVRCSVKVHCTAVLACEMASLQGGRGGEPPLCL